MGGVCRPPELLQASSRVTTYAQCSSMPRHAACTARLASPACRHASAFGWATRRHASRRHALPC